MKMRGKLAYIREVLRSYPEIQSKPVEKRTSHEQRRVEIVNEVLDMVDRMPDAVSRRTLVELVYFKKSHTLEGAALQIPISRRTAVRWNARVMKLMDETMQLP